MQKKTVIIYKSLQCVILVGMSAPITGPYFNARKAAEYCGFSYAYFRELAGEYRIPKYGPKRNMYAQSVLDQWMRVPNSFLAEEVTTTRGHKFKPIEV